MIIVDDEATVNSQIIVTLAKQALKNLNAPSIRNLKQNCPGDDFRLEFGTVKISLPRRSGHTTAALQLLFEHPGSLIFVYTTAMKINMQDMITEYMSDLDIRKRVADNIIVATSDLALKNIKPLLGGKRPFIIFDQTAMFREDVFNGIKNMFSGALVIVELQ